MIEIGAPSKPVVCPFPRCLLLPGHNRYFTWQALIVKPVDPVGLVDLSANADVSGWPQAPHKFTFTFIFVRVLVDGQPCTVIAKRYHRCMVTLSELKGSGAS